MTYERFEMAPAWKSSIELAERVFNFTRKASEEFVAAGSLREALEKSAINASNAIASGFEQGTTQAMITALHLSKGAVGETRSMLWLLEKMPRYADYRPDLALCREATDQCTRLLNEWLDQAQGLAQFGQKHYLDAAKEEERKRLEREKMAKERRELFDDLRRLSQS